MTENSNLEDETVYFIKNPISCDICHKTFSATATLNLHEEIFHGKKKKIVLKNEAIKNEYKENDYKILSSYEKRNFLKEEYLIKCKECLKSFPSNGEFKKHMQSHKSERCSNFFPCNQCPKAFSNEIGLEKHLGTHTGEKCKTPFKCNQCLKVFPSNSLFEKHVRTDTGEGCMKLFCGKIPKAFPSYEERKISLKIIKTSLTKKRKSQNMIFQVF